MKRIAALCLALPLAAQGPSPIALANWRVQHTKALEKYEADRAKTLPKRQKALLTRC